MTVWEWLWPTLTAAGFALLGFWGHALYVKMRDRAEHRAAGDLLREARRDADMVRKEAELSARDEWIRGREQIEAEMKARQQVLTAAAERLARQDERIEREEQRVAEQARELDKRRGELGALRAELEGQRDELSRQLAEARERLEGLAHLSAEEAREELLKRLDAELEIEHAARLRKAQEEVRATAEQKAREILTAAIQRYAADQVADVTTTAVHLPDESMKGRIIGREGRNIRALELATGVTVIIDDSPELVVLSSFDPIRREIARVVIERLMHDGRINPVLIEEMTDKVTQDVDALILQAGEEAVEALRLAPVPLDILQLLGRLKYRTSFSQNVLRHSIEAAHLAGMMAPEIGLDPVIAKRAALFHDLGKAVDHEVEGRHAEIGADLLNKAGESEVVVAAVREHHDTPQPESAYAALVAAADAITAARPGARAETTGLYLKRLEDLEALAKAEPGVVRALAMQAGRELRVFVEPTEVDDATAIQLARRISKKIEESLDFPGQIKVTVIRETRCVEYAR